MILQIDSKKSVDEITSRFEGVCKAHGFGLLGIHDLKKKMNEKGVPFEPECRVFEVCNPAKASEVLGRNMAISTALPCRVSVYTEGGTTKIATIKPALLLEMFNEPDLKAVAEDIEQTLLRIMNELA